jgi:signal transduction histidine kinase
MPGHDENRRGFSDGPEVGPGGLNTIPTVTWLTTPDGKKTVEVGAGYELLWGRSADSLRKNADSWMEPVVEEDLGRVSSYRRHIAASRSTCSCTYRILKPDGRVRSILDCAVPVPGEGKDVVYVLRLAHDITELAAPGLGETAVDDWPSGTFAKNVLDSLRDHVAVMRRDGVIVAVNDAWRQFAIDNDSQSLESVAEGVNYLEICSRSTGDADDYAERALLGLDEVMRGEAESFEMEYPCSSPEEERWFLMKVVPLRVPEGGCVVSHQDITSRKRAERELLDSERALRDSREDYRALARKLLTVGEDESRRLARELHDDLSQRLAVLSLEAGKLASTKTAPDTIPVGLKQLQDQIGAISRDIHAIARQLHPSILEDLGLDDALAEHCAAFSEYEGLRVDYVSEHLPKHMDPDVALNIYRIVQEALSNVAKHAEASSVSVSLVRKNQSLYLCIGDDGVGFERSESRGSKGLGLASMRERVAVIGGALTITTEPGNGTLIRVVVPLREDRSRVKRGS